MRKSTLLVFLILFGVVVYFVYGMITWNIFVSFTDWKGAIPSYNFVGLANYSRAFQDPLFWRSLGNTLLLFLAIPCSLGLGLFLATLLHQNVRGARVFTFIFLMPFAFSFVVSGVVWSWLASSWCQDPSTVMLSVIIAMVWQLSGYCALVLFAGMRSVPREEIDAAKSKGASTFRAYREVVFPRLKVPILASVVVLMVFTLKAAFDLVWTMTEGGPGTSSYNLPILVVNEAYSKVHVAYGAAVGTILVAIVLCIIIPYVYLSYRRR